MGSSTVRLDLTRDQEFFLQTTRRFLDDHVPVQEVRRLRDDRSGFSREYWRRGAELGWTSLLVREEHGGGSISGEGVVDLSLVAHEFGAHAAPGPLVPCNVVAAALSAAGNVHGDVLAAVMSGDAVATWAYGEPPPHDHLGQIGLEAQVSQAGVILRGTKQPVESAAEAGHILVTGRTGGGLTQVLVPTNAPGVAIRPLYSLDLTRRFSRVTFHDVRLPRDAIVGEPGDAGGDVERLLQLALVVSGAESVGAMQRAFDMALDWARQRYSFGRRLDSYQEIKHRFADMKTWLEASHAISDAAAASVQGDAPDAPEVTSAATAYIAEYGAELVQDCIQIHGGIGLTYEHDVHLFLRRVALNRALHGVPADHQLRLTDAMEGAGDDGEAA